MLELTIKNLKNSLKSPRLQNESGVALVLTVFVVSLATILVVEFGSTAYYDQRIARTFSESVQGNYSLKSVVNFASLVLELPKPEGEDRVDSLNHAWNLFGKDQGDGSSDIDEMLNLPGSIRATIIDEYSKLDVNAILNYSSSTQNNPDGSLSNSLFWKQALNTLMKNKGFSQESFEENEYQTLGNQGLEANIQVGNIQDWIDADNNPYSELHFAGLESGSTEEWFYNRPLKSLNELLLVPGMTSNRLSRLAPFVRVSPLGVASGGRINVNTARPELLESIGAHMILSDLLSARQSTPITMEALNNALQGQNPNPFSARLQVNSNEFSVIAKVELPSSTRWVKAHFQVSSGKKRNPVIRSIQIF